MLALTLICDPVIVDKLLLYTTVVIRWLTLDSLQNRTSCSINLCGIPRRLGGVEQFLLQTLRRATFFTKETANSSDKDSNLVKEMECSVKCISLNRCWFLFRVCGGGRGNILIVTELFYQICFVKLKMFLWKDLSHFFSLASLTKCRHESA